MQWRARAASRVDRRSCFDRNLGRVAFSCGGVQARKAATSMNRRNLRDRNPRDEQNS
jgi:hypothetical protein